MVDILHRGIKKERDILRQGFSVLLNCPRWDVDPVNVKMPSINFHFPVSLESVCPLMSYIHTVSRFR